MQSQSANSQSVQKEVAKDNFLYGYVLLSDGWEDIRKNKTMASGMTVLAVFVVFFLPCGLLALKEKPQAIITLLAVVIAGPALFFWVFVWGSPQIGGVLAIACWGGLLLASLVYLLRWALHWLRQRKTQT
ncbi:MAG: hypothetical protein HY254_21615 [Burkholderiales bacterium]|nr:hypothetical protein [Burkholderiales bacterium]